MHLFFKQSNNYSSETFNSYLEIATFINISLALPRSFIHWLEKIDTKFNEYREGSNVRE